MRILHLVAGAGGMYCGMCLQADTLASALVRAGHDVLVQPLYTPIRTEEDDPPARPVVDRRAVASHSLAGGGWSQRVLLGGVNVYLQQASTVFGYLPRPVRRWLSHPALLRWLGRYASTTQPEHLGPLTVSMLRGEHGRQRVEIDEAVRVLAQDARPDVVHLSTILLAGVATALRRRLHVPIVASLSGEDVFLDRLPNPFRDEAQALLRRTVGELAALIAPNRYFAAKMAGYLAVSPDRIAVVAPGVYLEGHRAGRRAAEPTVSLANSEPAPPIAPALPAAPRAIGFLGRLCEDKGLHLAADALILLAADPDVPACVLRAAGFLDAPGRRYVASIVQRLRHAGLADRFELLGEVDRAEKIAMLQSLDVLCLPTLHPEAKGLPALEAWANGVPVVVPDHGAFPEWIQRSGGGLLYRPDDAASLAAALRRLVCDRTLAAQCGRQGLKCASEFFHAGRMAEDTVAVYRRVVASA